MKPFRKLRGFFICFSQRRQDAKKIFFHTELFSPPRGDVRRTEGFEKLTQRFTEKTRRLTELPKPKLCVTLWSSV
jgi:hypothetical protein